jgi:hypothetical protein
VRRTLAIFLTLLLLWAGVGLVNDALSGAHVALFAGGLFITYAALALPLGEGLAASLLAGAVCDANTPVRFGTHALLFATAHVLLFVFRERLPHERTAGRVGIALLANAAIFLMLSFLQAGAVTIHANPWPRLASDLVFSQIFVAPVAPWFFALQDRILTFVPRDPERMF